MLSSHPGQMIPECMFHASEQETMGFLTVHLQMCAPGWGQALGAIVPQDQAPEAPGMAGVQSCQTTVPVISVPAN